jgi:PEP-CTERM/exosortase A-associated glycosyltransferase
MRILHILDHSLPLQSGYVFRTLGILGAQRGFGWDTVQLTTPRHNAGMPAVETVDGWTFHRTPRPAGALAARPVLRELAEMRAVAARLHELIAATRPDILHAHSPVLNGLPALWAARRAKLPVVYEVRALWEDAAVDLSHARPGGPRYRVTRALETFMLHRADAVVTLCQAMRHEIAARGVPAERIAVVPNAVDPAHFSAPQARDPALAESLGLAGRIVLGFIGSFYHYEGLDLLLAALPQIRAAVPQAMLLLVGGGPEAERLQRLAGELGVGDAVRFTGRVPHEQVRRYYDLVDFFVYPRRSLRLTELVTPLKPLEAMAEGRIVLASDIGGHRELIRDGETGFLFPPDDPPAIAARLAEAMLATDRHPPMRAAAHRFIESERTWPVSAAAYRMAYQRALAAKKQGQGAALDPMT